METRTDRWDENMHDSAALAGPFASKDLPGGSRDCSAWVQRPIGIAVESVFTSEELKRLCSEPTRANNAPVRPFYLCGLPSRQNTTRCQTVLRSENIHVPDCSV